MGSGRSRSTGYLEGHPPPAITPFTTIYAGYYEST